MPTGYNIDRQDGLYENGIFSSYGDVGGIALGLAAASDELDIIDEVIGKP